MKKTFFLPLLLSLLVFVLTLIDQISVKGAPSSTQIAHLNGGEVRFFAQNRMIRSQVDEIDRQIKELQEMKKGYEARAMRHEDYAQRLQFEDRAVLETRRHIELADENRLKADKIQEEINRLEIEKKTLLQAG